MTLKHFITRVKFYPVFIKKLYGKVFGTFITSDLMKTKCILETLGMLDRSHQKS